MTKLPYFKDMTDDELREAYWQFRRALHGWSEMAAPRRIDGGRSARGTGRCLRAVELIEAIADKRGISLARPDYESAGARALRSVTQNLRPCWTPETGWTD